MPELHIGLMSGTSLDGIDAALVDFSAGVRLVHALTVPFPADLHETLRAIIQQSGSVTLDLLGQTDARLGETYAKAVLRLLEEADVSPAQVQAIGCHGQTIRHRPDLVPAFTWQLGDPTRIATATGITTVADFRRMDVANGGQGAPLVPIFHAALFRSPDERRVVLNIGGIANITVLEETLSGYDTGPGNGLMDAWIEDQRGESFDRDGKWAASGAVDADLLARLLNDEYFGRGAPKSTGREYFNLGWLRERLDEHRLPAESIQATLLALTVETIAKQIRNAAPDRVLVCGGGARNGHLMESLRRALEPTAVNLTDDFGLDGDFVEAAAIAWLARERMAGRAANLGAATGAHRNSPPGAIYQP